MTADRHVHGHRTGRRGDDRPCVVRVGDWPYECIAKDEHPTHVVYFCDTHRCWWHEPRPIVIVTLTGRPDSRGRQRFTALWWADNVGPHLNEHGWRGQCFHMDPMVHAARWAARGYRVVTRTSDDA